MSPDVDPEERDGVTGGRLTTAQTKRAEAMAE
jgi:hypothetical protein